MVSGAAPVEFRHFVQLIAIGLQARIPMHMTGFPGVGKTEFTKSLEAGFDRVGIKCKVVVLVGSMLGLLFALALFLYNRVLRMSDRLPFGVFLSAGGWLVWLYVCPWLNRIASGP